MPTLSRAAFQSLSTAARMKLAMGGELTLTDDARPAEPRLFSADVWNRLPDAAKEAFRKEGAKVEGEARSATPPPGFVASPDGIGFLKAE